MCVVVGGFLCDQLQYIVFFLSLSLSFIFSIFSFSPLSLSLSSPEFVAQGGDPTGTGEGTLYLLLPSLKIYFLFLGGESVYGSSFKVSPSLPWRPRATPILIINRMSFIRDSSLIDVVWLGWLTEERTTMGPSFSLRWVELMNSIIRILYLGR